MVEDCLVLDTRCVEVDVSVLNEVLQWVGVLYAILAVHGLQMMIRRGLRKTLEYGDAAEQNWKQAIQEEHNRVIDDLQTLQTAVSKEESMP